VNRRRTVFARSVALATLLPFVSSGCGSRTPNRANSLGSGSSGSAPGESDQVLVQLADAPEGLDLRLSNGQRGAEPVDRATLPAAKKLSAAEAAALFARARALAADAGDTQDFALRPKSQPPPRTGQTIQGAFPPPASSLLPPTTNDVGKDLTVLRYMPEGQVPLAPELSVTFSQPMVAVTSQGDAAAVQPVKLTPTPAGKWRWIGTRTILFDPEIRFPQATTYRVEIPAGTRSATGNVQKAGKSFSFETPPPSMVASYPDAGPQHLDTPMFVLFDQKVDAQAVLSVIKVTAEGKAVALRLLDAAEIAKHKELSGRVEAANKDEQAGRWVAFRATAELPKDATISVELPAGTPSAEGPNRTKSAQQFSFRTYPPLRLTQHECGYDKKCPPGTPWSITFNNPLDGVKFDASQFQVTPAVPGLKVTPYGNSVSLQGNTKANTTYQVAISGQLADDFKQTLGKDASVTFRVTEAIPTFYGPSGMVVLDPTAKQPTFDVFTVNYEALKVKLYRVEPKDYDAYGFYLQNQWNRKNPPSMPGKKVLDKLVTTAKVKEELTETHIDLSSALGGGLGHVIAVVEPYPWKERWDPPRLYAWVQSTKLAVDAFVDSDTLHAFVTELATGKPADGVGLEMRPYGLMAKSDGKGLASFVLADKPVKGANQLVARRGNDVAFVSEDGGWWNEQGSWVKQPRGQNLAWYVIDDRKIYKPGEEVTLKGWLRILNNGKGGDVGWSNGQVASVSYRVMDSVGNAIFTGSAPVSAIGSFDSKFTLPKTPNLGASSIEFTASGQMSGTYYHSFQVEEFRRPEFEVAAQASQGPHLVGGGGDVTVTAKYFAGGPLPGADVNWFVTAEQTTFVPPNRDDFVFGVWKPWWGWHGWDEGGRSDRGGGGGGRTWNHVAKTDAAGAHTLHFDFLSSKPAVPMAVTASASVTDVNRQTWTASAPLLVHPSSLYVGLRIARPFVDKGTPMKVDVIGVDLDGKAALGAKIDVHTARLDWEYKNGKYASKEVDPQDCAVTAAADATTCEVKTTEGGEYQVTATIVDGRGRPNQSKLTFWVSGGDQPPSRDVERQQVQLIPDKKEYRAGDTAELLVQAPFYPAQGVVSWRRSGIVRTERISLSGPTASIKVPISDAMVPNLFVQVDLVGAAVRTDDRGEPDPKLPRRPAYAMGVIDLPIPPKQRTLSVTVTPSAAKLGPGETAAISVQVKDAAGQPVRDAETAIIVVDEAVLSLTGYTFPNPLESFYGARSADARDHYLRAYVKLAQPDLGPTDKGALSDSAPGGSEVMSVTARSEAAPAKSAPAAKPKSPSREKKQMNKDDLEAEAPNAGSTAAIAIRSNFNPLAAFSPAVRTGADGKATLSVKMPDNLTRYRIVAIASSGERNFGKGESAVTARLPLMVRPSPPRFLNFGDTFKLPVVLQNQTDAPMTVRVAVRATNAAITDGAGREVVVPANDRVEVQFPAAAEMAGTARFQVLGASGKASDAAELALPVWTPATTEAFATYGVIDSGAIKQPVELPGKVVTQFGGLEVTTSSTQLQALTDAFLYLVTYPFECAEQRASRILSIAALRDVLSAFKAEGLPTVAAMQARVATDLERLENLQNYDGGFPFWERGRASWPYLTVYVTNALVHAKQKGYAVPQPMLDRAKVYLRDIESHYDPYYPKEVRWSISSFALYTRKLMGDGDVAKGKRLIKEAGGVEKLPMEANGWLLGAFVGQSDATSERKAIVRHALNRVSETAGAANFTTSYSDGGYLLLASDRRVDGVMLESLIAEQKDLDLIPKLVTGLLAHKKAGRWDNTQDNTFVLVALDQYFQTYEKITPDFVARVWLGNGYAGDHTFKGRSTDSHQIDIPMKTVAAAGKSDLVIQKDGAGRLYYRVGMTYAPADLKLAAADYGFVVERRYQGVDKPDDVVRQTDGSWKIKAGARVRVRLTMVNENRRYHVALVDPLPAGLEAMNPALAVTGPIPLDPQEQKSRGAYWWWYGPWYEHQNLRDERIEAFASLLWEGVHTYEYVARATTPGNFVVPPPKAEEMYMPETFGRGASDRVIVE
jgi:alpha-2-macroglobulin